MTTCELRLKAVKEIETRGWCQGKLINEKGKCCLLGALLLASGLTSDTIVMDDENNSYYRFKEPGLLHDALTEMNFKSEYGSDQAFVFNDGATKKQEVIERLKAGCE